MTQPVSISEVQADYQDTEKSTAQTVKEMGRHVQSALHDPAVYQAAAECVGAWAWRKATASNVWRWLKNNVQFLSDEAQLQATLGRGDELELLIAPSVMLRADVKAGDCDDFTMLACAMLSCLGVPPLIKTFKCDRTEPWRWSHVCAAAVLEDGSIFPIDASHGDYPGWEVPARDQFETALWDMNGNKVGGQKMRGRGLGNYQKECSWTGNPMTTVSGPAAVPYPSLDLMRYYYPGPSRKVGLAAIARGKYRGMGACVGGFDEFGDACTDFTPITSDPTATAAAINYLYSNPGTTTLPATLPGASGQINWASIIGNLTAAGTKLGSQALLTPGSAILPNGTIVAGTPAGTSNLNLGGISSTTLLLIAAALGLVLVLKK